MRPLILLLLMAVSTPPSVATDIVGTVTSIEGSRVRVAVADASSIRLGDPVELSRDIPGVGQVVVDGAWQVVGIELGWVSAEVVGTASDTPRPGYQAVVRTGGELWPPATPDPALVRKIQAALLLQGFDPGPVDGNPSEATEAAIRSFQNGHRLPVDGQPSLALFEALSGDQGPSAPPDPAAPAGEAEAWYQRGLRYQNGLESEKDPALAAMWFAKAAAAGHAPARTRLGVLLATGQGVRKNLSAAARYWEQAAKAGVPEAQFNLGRAYHLGEGRPMNPEAARRWLTAAADQGNTDARELLAALAVGTSTPSSPTLGVGPLRSAPESRSPATEPTTTQRPPPATATLYLIRKKRSFGSAVRGRVTLDGAAWGELRSGRYLTAEVQAGPHLIQINSSHSPKRLSETRMVQLAPGQVLYLLRYMTLTTMKTVPIPEAEARPMVRRYKLASSSAR